MAGFFGVQQSFRGAQGVQCVKHTGRYLQEAVRSTDRHLKMPGSQFRTDVAEQLSQHEPGHCCIGGACLQHGAMLDCRFTRPRQHKFRHSLVPATSLTEQAQGSLPEQSALSSNTMCQACTRLVSSSAARLHLSELSRQHCPFKAASAQQFQPEQAQPVTFSPWRPPCTTTHGSLGLLPQAVQPECAIRATP